MQRLTGTVGRLLLGALAAVLVSALPRPGNAAGDRSTGARKQRTAFTWSVEHPPNVAPHSEVTITAAVIDPSDAVVIAGVADGPLDLGGNCTIAYGVHGRPFLAKVRPQGRLSWCRLSGPVSALFRRGSRTFAIALINETGFPAIALVGRDGTLSPTAMLPESHVILAIAADAKGDLFFGGCDAEWLEPTYPGLPTAVIQHDGFVGRATSQEKIVWRYSIRETSRDDSTPVDFKTPSECVTGLAFTERDGLFVVGPFRWPLAMGEWKLSPNQGTFVARVAKDGNLVWAKAAAIKLGIETTSHDVSPGIALSSGLAAAVTTGIVPTGAHPSGVSGVIGLRSDGAVAWTLGIQSDTLCCEVDDFRIGSRGRNLWVAGRVEERSVQIGRKPVKMSSTSNAFVAEISSRGSLLGVHQMPDLLLNLFAVLPGRNGAWVVGRTLAGDASTGLFVQWVQQSPRL